MNTVELELAMKELREAIEMVKHAKEAQIKASQKLNIVKKETELEKM